MNPSIDKRTNSYQRRLEATQKITDALLHLLEQAKPYHIPAKYLLFDSWFSFPSLIARVSGYGLHTICMLKDLPTNRFEYEGQRITLGELYRRVEKSDCKKGIFASTVVGIRRGKDYESIPARVIFVRDRSHSKDWLALLCTDTDLPEKEIIRIYGKRWDIEVFFKTTKSFLKLAKEFQGHSYDSMVAHTTVVFTRYMMLSLECRNATDIRSVGELFFYCCDEIKDITLVEALQRILTILKNYLRQLPFASEKMVDDLMRQFFDALPGYFKAWLPLSICES